MELAHEPGCRGRHTERQRCDVPPAPPTALEAAPQTTGMLNPRSGPSRTPTRIALIAEAALGLALAVLAGVMLVFGAEASWPYAVWLGFASLVGGVGWIFVFRLGTGCLMMVLRVITAVVLFVLFIQAFDNDSSCYPIDGSRPCWERSIRNYYVGFFLFALMPFGSALMLHRAIRTSRDNSSLLSRSWFVSSARGLALAIVVVILAPAAVGWAFSRTSIGEPTLRVDNHSGDRLLAYYRPGYAPADYIADGETQTLRPLFHRFDDPRSVTFVSTNAEEISTYWECSWDVAKAREPLVIDDANSAGCEKHSISLDGERVP